jgi:sporulation protein YlmC with PRC-barrel domain
MCWLRTSTLLSILAAVSLPAFNGSAQPKSDPGGDPSLKRYRFTHLSRMKIENRDGEVVGKLDDLILDLHSGRARYCVLVSGGFVGIGKSHKLASVPGVSMATAKRNILALTTAEGRWATLPDFRERDLVHLRRPKSQDRLDFASRLIGTTVYDLQQHKLGKISDVLVDLSGTRPVFAIVSTGSPFKNARLAIPIQALGPRGRIPIAAPAEAVAQAPWFGRAIWQVSSTNNPAAIYRYDDTPENKKS